MNTKQRIMVEFNKRSAGASQKSYALGNTASQPAPTPGRSARAMPKMGIGLADFWFGKKNQHHQHQK